MKQVLVVWHSMTGGARAMAQAFAQGVSAETAVQCRLLHALQVQVSDVLAADAYAFITPETLGSMAGLMKDFFDRTYYPALDRIQGRPCMILVCAGSDGSGAVRQLQRIITGWRLREVAPPLTVCTHAQTPETIAAEKTLGADHEEACRLAGLALASGLAMGLF